MGESIGDGEAGGGERVEDLNRRELEVGAEVRGYYKIGIGMKKGSERWNDSVKKVVKKKKNIV